MSRFWRRRDEIPVVELQRTNPVRFGIVLIVVMAIVVYFGFTKAIPFKHGFQMNAVFTSAQNIKPKSPVRIAGVTVGEVKSIHREGNVGVVTMEIASRGLPIHSDAQLKIRPRIFLEGNWFVELQPGSPSAPTISSGHTIPITQTAVPVQLDQVLNALNTDTRANLQRFLISYGEGLTRQPNAAEDAEQDPEVRGINAAQALNKAYHRGPNSLRGGAIINQALAGTSQDDLSKLVASVGKVTAALNVHEQALSELIGNFNTFFRAFAVQSAPLRTLVAELPSNLAKINGGLVALHRALPPAREFSQALIPGVKLTPATVKAVVPWLEQVQASLQPSELGGVAAGLAAGVPHLAALEAEQTKLYEQTDLFNKCLTKLIYPAGNTKLQDGTSSSGVENYKEFWYSLVGLAGIGQGFDGNGSFARFLVGNSGNTLVSAPASAIGTNFKGLRLIARTPLAPLGTRPAFPGVEPAYQTKYACYKQVLPEFNGPLSQGPADGTG